MKSWLVEHYGEPKDVLVLRDVAEPTLGVTQVLVDIRACSLNFPDVLLCRGTYQQRPTFPFSPGLEASGEVIAIGADVQGIEPGTRVIVIPTLPAGALVERLAVDVSRVFPVPDSMPFEEAACMFGTYQTAWFGLHRRAGLRAGETLLVHAAAGGVGSASVQLGLAAGARVIATAGSEEKLALCRELGVEVAIDYVAEDFVDAVMAATDGLGVDVVMDPVGGDVLERSLRCTAWEGRVIVAGFAGGRIPDIAANRVLMRNISLVGLHWGPYLDRAPHQVIECHDELVRLYEEGFVRPILKTAPFDEVPQALEALGDRRTMGKVVIVR